MKTKLHVIKIGGAIIDDAKLFDAFLHNFTQIKEPKILIHGGGKIATRLSEKLKIPVEMIDGRRITTEDNLDVVTMVYAGLVNTKIVAKLQGLGCNAIGLSGVDANCISSYQRDKQPIDFGHVGDVDTINTQVIQVFLDNGMIPVFNAIGHDTNGQLLNTNADTVAAELAINMSKSYATDLVYCSEKSGVLMNEKDDNSLILTMNMELYSKLKTKGIVTNGMLPKLDNCFYALNQNVSKVIIGNQNAIDVSNRDYTTLTL